MRTLFLATAAFAALVMVAPIGVAHADIDQWTKNHLAQFDAKWRGNPGAGASKEWHAAYRRFCIEGEMHQVDIGVWSAADAVERIENCNKFAGY